MANKLGLVSISFRQHSKEDILKEAALAGIEVIEWGGDVHTPHGDEAEARETKRLSEKYSIEPIEYGSYYAIGQSEPKLFEKVLLSAEILGTKIIRVWAGMGKPSDTFTEEEYLKHVKDAKRICKAAKNYTVALECHPNTLTDEYHTALKFLRDVNMPNLKMFWQPNQHRPLDYNLDSIKALLPYIVSVHVFSWERKTKHPLAHLEENWKKYIELLGDKDINYMLEFMHDGRIETLFDTARTLKRWI